ncbi:MAG: peptidoglycan-binding protein LysM [Neisseriaceae bacterium]
MGLFNFLKDAGEKIFGTADDSHSRGNKATEHIRNYNIPGAHNVVITYSDDGVATVTGECDSAGVKQLVLVAAGNIAGVKEVNDQLHVTGTESTTQQESDFYEVKSGDTLSKIAQHFYGDSEQYNLIFEANKPMLKHPDKIYPGQVLIIPKK